MTKPTAARRAAWPRPPQFKLQVRRSEAGLGLYAAEPIPAGRFVIEYWGELVPDEAANEVAGRYLFELGNGKTILGATRANTARYANHSCAPSCEARQQGNHVYLFSLRPIAAGEAITYDYGEDYFKRIIGGRAKCLCKKCDARRAKPRRRSSLEG
jgi:SET domain-containing protein